jgi:hypothetical protein
MNYVITVYLRKENWYSEQDCHDITEILLKVVLNTINLTLIPLVVSETNIC